MGMKQARKTNPLEMKNLILSLMTVLLVLSTGSVDGGTLKISAFNMKVFGTTKAAKPDVMEIIVKIVRNYDIILLQEIRQTSGEAIQQLLDEVNAEGAPLYNMVLSQRLGRTSSKEQYAFMYRNTAEIGVLQTYQYPVPEVVAQKVFEREPFSVKFSVAGDLQVTEIVLAAIHAKPGDAVAEIDELDVVQADLHQQFKKGNISNIMILGDLNADCTYVTQTEMGNLVLRNDAKYHWLIDDETDTTVSSTDCAYDRFIVTGEDFFSRIVSGSDNVFRFDLAYNLTATQAAAVSDHYPIEVTVEWQTQNDVVTEFLGSVKSSLLVLLGKFGIDTTEL